VRELKYCCCVERAPLAKHDANTTAVTNTTFPNARNLKGQYFYQVKNLEEDEGRE
jgi:hypothetical protein